jgi:hypothetical protein
LNDFNLKIEIVILWIDAHYSGQVYDWFFHFILRLWYKLNCEILIWFLHKLYIRASSEFNVHILSQERRCLCVSLIDFEIYFRSFDLIWTANNSLFFHKW